MKKKKAAKKRPKAKTRTKARPKTRAKARASATQKSRAKGRPRARTGSGLFAEARSRQSTQSGDTQGLSDRANADSESVKELEEEGQYLEAEAVEGVEDAPDADAGPIKTREVPEDDVPEEYLDDDNRDEQS